MLKWTVGQRRATGGRTSPSRGGGPCYSIRRAAARLYHSRRCRTPSRARALAAAAAASSLGAAPGKENRQLVDQLGGPGPQRLTPRTRDSVYMRLDALPAALRDVSNHLQQETRLGSPAESSAKRGRRSTSRTRRINRLLKHAGDGTNEVTTTPRRNLHRSAVLQQPALSSSSRQPKRTRLSQGEVSLACSNDRSMVTLQPEQATMQIDYSPCPLRTTKSLIALRRRLEDTFPNPHHSVGTLHPTPHQSLDNPLYYTLSGRTSNLPRCSGDDIPAKIRRKNIMSYSNDIPWNITPSKALDSETNVPANTCSQDEKDKETTFQVSAITRNMASLNLNNFRESSETPASSPPVIINSAVLPSSDKTRNDAVGVNHDVTDPRFLSHFFKPDSTIPAGSNARDLPGASCRDVSQENDTATGKIRNSHGSAVHNSSLPTIQHEDVVIRRRSVRSLVSLRRCATKTFPSETKLDHLNVNGERSEPYPSQSQFVSILADCSINSKNSSVSEIHAEGVRHKESIASPSVGSVGNIGNTSGRDSLCKRVSVCDKFVSDDKEQLGEFDNSRESLERSFSLRRQGGFRRRHRAQVLSERKANVAAVSTVASCSLLGVGDASSQCTSLNTSLIANAPSSVGSKVGGPASSRQSRRAEEGSGQVDGRHFGLTLSQGIPSPPSPACGEDDVTASLGVRPLAESPPPFHTATADTTVAVWKGGGRPGVAAPVWRRNEMLLHALRGGGVVQQHGSSPASSSDETWNSHTMRFLKTPQLTSGHILDGAAYTTPSSSANTSASRTDQDVSASPVALVERRSRSRRCLTFASPGGSTKQRRVLSCRRSSGRRRSRDCQNSQQKGELELAVYANCGLLTIHVIRGWNLYKTGGKSCNAYVKVNLVPCCEERTFHRTSVQRDTSNPWFDQKFSFEVLDSDLDKRVLVSVWHRDKDRRRSEFLGCMSFAVKHAIKKDIGGSFRLLSQSSGQTQHQPAAMSCQSVSSSEEVISLDTDVPATPKTDMERRKSCTKKPVENKAVVQPPGNDDSSFLRHLELEPAELEPGRTPGAAKGGRTPFTTTRRLSRHSKGGFGFSIAWTQPPRVERVEAGLPADCAGLRPGDYVIFVEKHNVVTMPEEEILNLIRSCGNQLTLEIYRRATPNGLVGGSSLTASAPTLAPGAGDPGAAAPSRSPAAAPSRSPAAARSSVTTCSATTASLDLSKRRLHLPQVTFSSETEPLNREDSKRRAVYQLLSKEQQYAMNMQFGISRFLLPLSDRRDLLTVNDHLTLFQNAEELLRLTEDVVEMLLQEEGENFGQSIGRIYLKKMSTMNAAYRRYFSGIKKADCLLAAKTRNSDFMRIIVEPAVPRRRPDLTAFLHKPLEHYREVLKLLQTLMNTTKVTDDDYPALTRIVQEMQAMYREVTIGAGLMEPEGEGRPLLSLQDLESRLVFTRCKPFVLGTPGRQWIFGGDLSRVEGRAVRPFWALLFTDLILFAKVSRDRVLFITEEPLPLLSVTQAFFNIRKKANDFRLLVAGGTEGTDSPAQGGCGPELQLTRHPKKGPRRRPITLRAPTAELKAVWQNLIQRQIIYLNTIRGGTPASSPLDSPDPPTTLSVATLDSLSLRRQQAQLADCSSQRHLDELIEHRCRRLGKSGSSKGSALHLAQWIKGQLGSSTGGPLTPDEEPEPEVWSPETLRRRSEQLNLYGVLSVRNESRCEEIDVSDTERSQSLSTSDSQVTVRSSSMGRQVAVCRQCHKTCLASSPSASHLLEDEPEIDDNWGPLILMGMSALKATVGLGADPFSPTEVPLISVLPPTPDTLPRNSSFQWEDGDTITPTSQEPPSQIVEDSPDYQEKQDEDEDSGEEGEEDPPYRSLSSSVGMKRYGTLASLDMVESDEEEDEEEDADDILEWKSGENLGDSATAQSGGAQQQLEAVSQSLRGWTARAGSYVAEKMALFEDTRAAAFLDRYLRPASSSPPDRGDSPPDQNTASSGTEDCETSAATSADDVWGTPTSGGELDEEQAFPPADTSIVSESSADSISSQGPFEELMMEELLAAVPMPGVGVGRGFPARRRLEPLPEEEDTDSPPRSPSVAPEDTPSPEQGNESGDAADSCLAPVESAKLHRRPGLLHRLRLRKTTDEDQQAKSSRLLGFLRKTGPEPDGGGGSVAGRPLFRMFSREYVDDIPTSLPPQLTPRRHNEKQLERRFWKQLRRRRLATASRISA